MKKALIASTALVLTAGVAAADVTISGYGRTGVQYYEDGILTGGNSDTQVISRLRMNIDAATSTDQGVDFGARFRIQWDQNQDTEGRLNAGKLYVTSSGLTVEVGNVDTAFDSAGLLYANELGSYDRQVGFLQGSFFSYSSDSYQAERLGVAAKYSIAGATLRASYVDPDQTGATDDNEEFSLAVDYTWNERLELSGAYVTDGAGIEDNDIFFIGARYAVMENARIGLNYVDASNDSAADVGNSIALYGDYTLADGLTNIEAYIANNDADYAAKETDNAFGIGVNYDLGGARLGASLHRDYQERVTADMGVRFDF